MEMDYLVKATVNSLQEVPRWGLERNLRPVKKRRQHTNQVSTLDGA